MPAATKQPAIVSYRKVRIGDMLLLQPNPRNELVADLPQLMPTGAESETFGGVTYHIGGELVPVLTVDVSRRRSTSNTTSCCGNTPP